MPYWVDQLNLGVHIFYLSIIVQIIIPTNSNHNILHKGTPTAVWYYIAMISNC